MEPTELTTDRYGAPKYAGQRMTKADFLRWESDDNYVYEYNDGLLEPTTSMKQEELPLLTSLTNYFFQTDAFRSGGRLWGEVDVWLTEKQLRRPDVAYFTDEQMRQIAAGEKVVPGFVIEFSSEYDDVQKDLKKLHEYFNAGVQVVWWVYPLYQTVYIYTSPKTVTISTDADQLSPGPARFTDYGSRVVSAVISCFVPGGRCRSGLSSGLELDNRVYFWNSKLVKPAL